VIRAHCAVACLALSAFCAPLTAQSVVLDGPTGSTLPSITPAFSLVAVGFGALRPLAVRLQIGTSPDFVTGVIVDTIFVVSDTVVAIQVTRPLTSEARVYWKARVENAAGLAAESLIGGPRLVPSWVTLLDPNSPQGNTVEFRRPLFVWRSAAVTPLAGQWKYDVEITTSGLAEQGTSGLVDTVYRAATDLQTNTRYKWSVRATLNNGPSFVANSLSTFFVRDPALPARTLLYQNFPNPFPSPSAFSTCIWFDVAEPGARIALDLTDLRGNLVRTLIPGVDGQRDFVPGRYGQGAPGTGSNCDNRFVWDGTGNDGRTVAAGVYLLRFQAGRAAPSFRRVLFLGR
jgi:hypothetical protein